MQRVRARRRNAKKRKKTREPLAEGIVPLTKDGRRSWASMSDEELVSHAKKFMEEKGISGRGESYKADCGLYCVLRKRKLLDRAFSDTEKTKEKEEIQQIVEGLKEFAA